MELWHGVHVAGGHAWPKKGGLYQGAKNWPASLPGARIFLQKMPPFCRMAIQGSSIHQDCETIERILAKDRGFGDESQVGIVRESPEDFGIIRYVIRNLGNKGKAVSNTNKQAEKILYADICSSHFVLVYSSSLLWSLKFDSVSTLIYVLHATTISNPNNKITLP